MFEEYLAVGPEDETYLASIPQTTVSRYLYDHIQTFDPDKIAEVGKCYYCTLKRHR